MTTAQKKTIQETINYYARINGPNSQLLNPCIIRARQAKAKGELTKAVRALVTAFEIAEEHGLTRAHYPGPGAKFKCLVEKLLQ